MDNNNPTPPPASTEPAAPIQAAPPAADTAQNLPPTGAPVPGPTKVIGKMIWVFMAVVLIIVIVSGGVFYWISTNQAKQAASQQKKPAVEVTDLKSEAESIKDDDIESDFQQVDSDLQSL